MLNIDVAINNMKEIIGWEIMAKEKDRRLISAWAGSGKRNNEAMIEEANVIRQALLKAKQEGWRCTIIQSDCKTVVEKNSK